MDKRTRLYAQLLDASKERRETNIAEHKLRTGRIKRSLGAKRKLRESKKEAKIPKVPLDFLAIGDSWFEYPLYNEGLSFQNNAIVAKSQLGSMGNPPPQILNQALHGQATTAMLSWENQDKMITVLQDSCQWLNVETHLPDAILVSAGGDDLVGDQLAIYLDYGGGGLDLKRFQGVLDSVRASYFDLFALRDIFAKGVPVIGHCYDYAIPNDVHPICTPSAWLWPSFNFAGYDYGDGLQIVTNFIDLFHDMLADLASDLELVNVHLIFPLVGLLLLQRFIRADARIFESHSDGLIRTAELIDDAREELVGFVGHPTAVTIASGTFETGMMRTGRTANGRYSGAAPAGPRQYDLQPGQRSRAHSRAEHIQLGAHGRASWCSAQAMSTSSCRMMV